MYNHIYYVVYFAGNSGGSSGEETLSLLRVRGGIGGGGTS